MGKLVVKLKRMLGFLPDKLYLQMYYFARYKRLIDFKNPKTFNQKLQWLKLNYHHPDYPRLVDKYEVRTHIAQAIGERHLIPLVGGPWNSFEEIDFDSLPEQFVLKCTHDSGGLVICRDKSKLDIEAARKKITNSLKRDYYLTGREWPYKSVKHRIIAEQYMEDNADSHTLKDYKVFCFDGQPKTVMTVTGGHDNEAGIQRRMYDTAWNLLPIGLHGHSAPTEAEEMPEKLPEILELAKMLSEGKPHVRADFYVINGQVYFGELTFFHMSGFGRMDPPQWEETFGSWLTLPEKMK